MTESSAVTIPTTDSDKDAEDKLRKTVAQSLPQSVKVRPWDLGKEGVPKQPGNDLISFLILMRGDSFTAVYL